MGALGGQLQFVLELEQKASSRTEGLLRKDRIGAGQGEPLTLANILLVPYPWPWLSWLPLFFVPGSSHTGMPIPCLKTPSQGTWNPPEASDAGLHP